MSLIHLLTILPKQQLLCHIIAGDRLSSESEECHLEGALQQVMGVLASVEVQRPL